MSGRLVRVLVTSLLAMGLLGTAQANGATSVRGQAAHAARPITTMLQKVSCAADGDCLAIGWHTWRDVGISLLERWDGRTWSRVQVLAWTTRLDGVSCVGADWCMVVGSARGPHQGPVTYSETLVDRHIVAVPTPTIRLAEFEAVACASMHSCYAVGSYQPRNEYVRPLVEHWNGHRWHLVRSPYLHNHFLQAISCGAAVACMASGYQSQGGRPFAERLTGGRWIPTRVPTFTAPSTSCHGGLPCLVPLAPQNLTDDSCSAVRCVAVSHFGQPVIWSWTKRGWVLERDPSTQVQFDSVACWNTSCLLLGSGAAGRSTVVYELLGGRWRREAGFGATLTNLTCVAPSRCMAVGFVTGKVDHGTTKSVAAQWTGHSWRYLPVPR